MKIFLTGGNGMVGRNFRASALQFNHQIHAPNRQELNLLDKDAVRAYVRELKPDIVIHAAGRVGGIAANMADPFGFLFENLEMGAHVVGAAVAEGVPRLLNLSSSCVYPKDVDGELREDMILTGAMEPTNEGYALAKVATLRLCEYASLGRADLSYKTLVPCNLFGEHDNFDPISAHLIPAIIRKVHEAKIRGLSTVEIWGDGSARREFMYTGDLAEAMHLAIDRFESLPSVMNIGVGHDHSVLDFYEAVAGIIGWTGQFQFDLSKPAGMRRKLVSTARQSEWGWQARTTLEEGIRRTYSFFLSERSA